MLVCMVEKGLSSRRNIYAIIIFIIAINYCTHSIHTTDLDKHQLQSDRQACRQTDWTGMTDRYDRQADRQACRHRHTPSFS